METSQRLLFLAGLARSSTTALLHVLNAHPEIAIGMERYKRVVSGSIDRLSAELFTKERFFGDPDATSLKAVLDFLGLPWEPGVAAEFERVHREYVDKVAGRDRTLSPELRGFVDELADRGLWDAVVKVAV